MHSHPCTGYPHLPLARDNRAMGVQQQLLQIPCIGRRATAKAGENALDNELCSQPAVAVTAGAVGQDQAPLAPDIFDSEAILVARPRTYAGHLCDLQSATL